MAEPLKLSATHLSQVAAQIGNFPVSDLLVRQRRSRRRLSEHFELWLLPAVEPAEAHVRLETLATFSTLTHHQIRLGDAAIQFALSSDTNGADRQVHAVFTSPLSRKIDAAIRWIDQTQASDGERARLLHVPSRAVYALWLYGKDNDTLVVASKPNMGGALAYKRCHSLAAFLSALSRREPICPATSMLTQHDPVDVEPPNAKRQ